MKHVTRLHYSIAGGVQYERRLRKSTQFIAGSYLMAAALGVVLVSHGLNSSLDFWHKAAPAQVTTTKLVAKESVALDANTVPAAPGQSSEPDQLSAAIQTYIDNNAQQTWSVAVYDISNQRWLAHVNAQEQITSGSLQRLYAAYALSIKLAPNQWSTTQLNGQSVQDCVDQMLRTAGTACGAAITNYVGTKTIDTDAKALGFTGTASNVIGGPVTTAYDSAHFMAMLYQGKLFDPATTAFILNSLQHQVYRQGIPAGCPDCTTYNKTSYSFANNSDVGVVVSGSRTYSVAILSQGGTSVQIAELEKAIDAVLHSSQGTPLISTTTKQP